MGYLSYRNAVLARKNYFQAPIDEANTNIDAFSQNQDQQQQVADSSWFSHPIAKATQVAQNFLGLEDVLPEVQRAPQAYNDLRNLQIKQNADKSIGNRVAGTAKEVAGAVGQYAESSARTTLDPTSLMGIQRPEDLQNLLKPVKATEQFLSGFVDVGKDIYQGSMYSRAVTDSSNKINSLISKLNKEVDPAKKTQLQEILKQETQKLNDIPVPDMMNKTNAQLIAKAGLATFNTMLTAVTFGTGSMLAKGGEKVSGNFLENILKTTLEKAPVELGADATFKQIITSDLTKLAQNKIFNAVAKVVGNKATAQSVAIGGAYMAAGAVKDGETDLNKIKDATVQGMAFGWLLDRGMTGLVKGGSKLLGLDTQRQTLQSLISDTENKLGRPLTETEKLVAIQSFKNRVGTEEVASGLKPKSFEEVSTTPKLETNPAIKPKENVNPLIQEVKKSQYILNEVDTNNKKIVSLGKNPADLVNIKTNKPYSNLSPELKSLAQKRIDLAKEYNISKSNPPLIQEARKVDINSLSELRNQKINEGNKIQSEIKNKIQSIKDEAKNSGLSKYMKADGNIRTNAPVEIKSLFNRLNSELKVNTEKLNNHIYEYSKYDPSLQGSLKNVFPEDLKKFYDKRLELARNTEDIATRNKLTNIQETINDFNKSQPLQEGGKVVEKVAEVKQPEIIGGTKVAKLAKDVNAQAIERNLTKAGFPELAGYGPKVIKVESEKISKLMANDMQGAVDMATGKKPVEGVHPQMLFNAVENAFKDDAQVMMDLARSPIATERSVAAQTLGLSAQGNLGSTVSHIQDVAKAREKYATRKFGDITKAAKKELASIDEHVKKIPHIKETWKSFVNSIQC